MPTLNNGAICPGFIHFKLNHKGLNNEVIPVTIDYQLCNLCQCALVKRITNGKFVVKCTFDKLKLELTKNKDLLKEEIEIWKLRFEVLKEPEKAIEVITIRKDRRERMKDDIILREESEHAKEKHTEEVMNKDLDDYLKDVM